MLPKLQLNVWVLNVLVPDVPVLIVLVLKVREPSFWPIVNLSVLDAKM